MQNIDITQKYEKYLFYTEQVKSNQEMIILMKFLWYRTIFGSLTTETP